MKLSGWSVGIQKFTYGQSASEAKNLKQCEKHRPPIAKISQ